MRGSQDAHLCLEEILWQAELVGCCTCCDTGWLLVVTTLGPELDKLCFLQATELICLPPSFHPQTSPALKWPSRLQVSSLWREVTPRADVCLKPFSSISAEHSFVLLLPSISCVKISIPSRKERKPEGFWTVLPFPVSVKAACVVTCLCCWEAGQSWAGYWTPLCLSAFPVQNWDDFNLNCYIQFKI